jgi:hypothetical protein
VITDKWIVKYENNVYLVCDDPVDEYHDNHIFISKTDRMVVEEPFPSSTSSYNIVKVLWYYEPGRKLVRCIKNIEDQLTAHLTEELARQIDAEILRTLLEEMNQNNE